MAVFDAYADDYDKWYQSKLGNFVDKVEKELIEEMADFRIGESLLEIGSGTGTYSIWLAKKGINVTGLDQSKAMMNIAKEKAEKEQLKINWKDADAKKLPFPNESFDIVISVTAIEFMDDREAVLAEAVRVLKPNGRIIIGILTKESPWGKLYQGLAESDKDNLFAKAHLFLEEELEDLLPIQFKLKKGLYIPPLEEFNENDAWILEKEKQLEQANSAGFFVIRWDKEE